MPLLLARSDVALSDQPNRLSEFLIPGIDKIDVTALTNDVKLELLAMGAWAAPIRVRAGLHRSIAGLTIAYERGAEGFRLSNYIPGQPASADIEVYSVG